ncbi:hypothetical protein Q1695_002062 [Nippostrongylus brasiliensis]|nr:hypothetical protein Q1695_002062 [Nippostrongylus brasiliensis]
MRALPTFLLTLPSVLAMRCHDYISTSENRQPMRSWVDCPIDVQFCFKSYEEQRDGNAPSEWVSKRSCGPMNLCVGGTFIQADEWSIVSPTQPVLPLDQWDKKPFTVNAVELLGF